MASFGGGIVSMLGGSSLGTLFIRLVADSSKVIKGMTDAERAVAGGAAKMSGQLQIFQKAAVGAFTAAAGAFAFFTKQAINGADEMNRLAQIAGQTVDAFSGLAAAAELADVSAGELAQSTKFLSAWLEKAGRSTANLTEEIIRQADEFAAMEDGAVKIRMAVERFGRAGAAMIPFLNQGSQAIREQIEEARIFHSVIGPEFGRNADTFNDNLTRINKAFKGVFNVVAEELLPVWIEMQERFIEWIKETDAVTVAGAFLIELFENATFFAKRFALGVLAVWTTLKTLGTLIGSSIAMAFELVLNHVNGVVQLFGIWVTTTKGVIDGLAKMASVASLAAKAVSSAFKGNFLEAQKAAAAIPTTVAEGWDQIAASVKQGASAASGLVVDTLSKDFGIVKSISESTVETIGEQWVTFLQQGESLLKPVEVRANAVKKEVDKMAAQIQANAQKAEEIMKAGDPAFQALDPFTTQSVGIGKEQAEAEAKLAILKQYAVDYLAIHGDINEEVEKSITAHHEKVKALQMAQFQVILQSGQNAFDSLAQATASFAGEQSDIYKTMFAASKAFAIAESIIKIQQGVANALSLPYPFNIAAAASVVAAAANIVTTISSVQLAFDGERAAGGPVTAGRSYLVGEKGPELFAPKASGTIVPNDALGGGTKVIINNYTDASAQVTERDGGKIIEVVLKRVKSDLASEVRDGRGDVNRAMESSYGLRRGAR